MPVHRPALSPRETRVSFPDGARHLRICAAGAACYVPLAGGALAPESSVPEDSMDAKAAAVPGTALVTGAPRRIGRAIALGLAARGWAVAIHCRRSDDDARALAAEIGRLGARAAIVEADLSQAAALAPLLADAGAALGPVTCLVNNASLFHDDTIARLDAAIWDANLAVNLRAPVLLPQAFARSCRPAPAATSSTSSTSACGSRRRSSSPMRPQSRRCGRRRGCWRRRWRRASASTPSAPGRCSGASTRPTPSSRPRRGHLLGRGTTPEEIAAAVRFILDAPAMTGQMIALDGGQHLAWETPESKAAARMRRPRRHPP